MPPLHDVQVSDHPPLPRSTTTLADLALGLARSVTSTEVLDVIADRGRELVGAGAVTISVLEPDGHRLRLVTSRSMTSAILTAFALYDVDAQLPSADALRTGRTVLLHSPAERDLH